MLTVAICTERY